jgi:hypothetical protein
MARIRTIKPQHVNDKELSKIPLQAHLFWVLSWCFSDDEGVMENDALLLKSQIFPRRTDIRVEQVQQWIDHLIKARFIIPFTHEGEGYLLHRTFKNHQKIDRPQDSKIPKEIIRRIIDECSTNDRPCIVEDSKVKESSVAAGEVSPPAPSKHAPEDVEAFSKLSQWIKERANAVSRMKEPLKIEEFIRIRERFTDKNFIAKTLLAMHNWDGLKKRRSAYLTFLRFAEKEEESR